MADQFNVQVKFFNEIKNKLEPNLNLVDVIADELEISNDSAYRRIRGEKSLSLEELKKLCNRFGISLDAIITSTSDTVLFSYRSISPENFDFDAWLNSVIDNMKALSLYDLKEIIYGAKDLPFFYYFTQPRLTAFKLFFWMRNIYGFPGLQDAQFDIGLIPDETVNLAKKIWQNYLQIPSIEIWSEETISVTLRQIDYYYNSGRFKSDTDAREILAEYKSVLKHIEKQAEAGKKFDFNARDAGDSRSFQLYMNEVIILDNTVYFRMDDFNMVHMAKNVMNILSTSDPGYCKDTYSILKNMMKNGLLISSTSEKERNRFFNMMYGRIDAMAEKIK